MTPHSDNPTTKNGYFYTNKKGEVKFRKNKKGPWFIVTTPSINQQNYIQCS